MANSYDTLEGSITVQGVGQIAESGDDDGVAIVGGYDSANADASVTAGEETLLQQPVNAADTLGASELSRLAQSVAANGVSEVYAVPVPETDNTETFSATNSMTLSESPIFDPDLHPEHDVTVTDTVASTDFTVNTTYESSPSQPSDSETAVVNPVNGEVATSTSSDFEVSYTYGTYTDAIRTAAEQSIRNVIVATEAPAHKSTLVSDLSDIATDFDFRRGFVGAQPDRTPSQLTSYTPDSEDWRLVSVAPSRGENGDGKVRTVGAIGAYFATQPIGPDGSGLFDEVDGLTALKREYRASTVKDTSQLTVITRSGEIGRAKTTSADAAFEDIYVTEIIDEVSLGLFNRARQYAGGVQDVSELRELLSITCQDYATGSPPALGLARDTDQRPYDVSTSLDPNDNSIANASVSIVPYPIAEEVNLTLNVADGFLQFQGAN